MNEPSLMRTCEHLLDSLGMIAIIVTAIGLMVGVVKPADALKHVGAILGVVILLILLPCILAGVWLEMSWWQRIGLIAIGVGIAMWRRPRRQSPGRKEK